MEHLKKGTSNATTAIEGDVKGAYDNVVPSIMMKILSNKIKDKQFLKLIQQGFEAGIFYNDIYENTSLGIPQGGIASPILFNIYMHEFDTYVLDELQAFMDNINKSNNRTGKQGKYYSQTKKKILS
jgi:retron-type reverse transcriptase